jgi:hypothetical protein
MKVQLLVLVFLTSLNSYSQEKIAGCIKGENGLPLSGANVYIKGTYDGSISDTSGHFKFFGSTNDTSLLVVSYIGYSTFELTLKEVANKQQLDIHLKESAITVETVVITAGSFQAGEKSRAVLLNPIEIATTASSDGDVYGALKTFPGVQKQGETGKIIVRGGDDSESKTYMDGMLVSSPYNSSLPELPSRGRFSPFMFNGVMFSTGGYSAEYGQALSSVLELKTPGLFDEDITSISLINVGVGVGYTKRYDKMAYSAEINYNNLYPYFLMAKNDLKWIDVPQNLGGNFYHRVKVGNEGMLKTDFTYSRSYSKLDYRNFDIGYDAVGMKENNLFFKTGYDTKLGKKWLVKVGVAYNANHDNKDLDNDKLKETHATTFSKLGFTNFLNSKTTLRFGADVLKLDSKFSFFVDSSSTTYGLKVNDMLSSVYAESDIKLTKNLALRVGVRGEYTRNANKYDLAPRISLARKISSNSQVSLAWGEFYQQPATDYLFQNSVLGFQKATHYLVNYQVMKNNRVFRSEVYYKQYKNLLTYSYYSNGQYQNLQTNGYGYARGIDLFWKDDKSIKYATYWISYSYIDSKRKYKEYPSEVTPEFVTNNNLAVVLKYWIQPITTQACITYNYSSGRPYNNPNEADFMGKKTHSFHDISGNLSYITNIFGYFTVVHLSVSNILGLKNIYTYRYSANPDEDGKYQAFPVSSMVQRTIILGVFVSMK